MKDFSVFFICFWNFNFLKEVWISVKTTYLLWVIFVNCFQSHLCLHWLSTKLSIDPIRPIIGMNGWHLTDRAILKHSIIKFFKIITDLLCHRHLEVYNCKCSHKKDKHWYGEIYSGDEIQFFVRWSFVLGTLDKVDTKFKIRQLIAKRPIIFFFLVFFWMNVFFLL